MNSSRCFLLSYVKYGDNDAVIHCFTEETGYESFFIRGIYSAKNKKKVYLQPLKELSLTFSNQIKTGAIRNIAKIEPYSDLDLGHDVKISTMVFFLSDFMNQVLRNENKNAILYREISKLISELQLGNLQSHLVFLFKFLSIQGLNPLYSNLPYLNPENGIFTNEKSHPVFDAQTSELWKAMSLAENPYTISISAPLRKTFLESLLIYYHYHFSDFRIPNSLEIVQQIFQN